MSETLTEADRDRLDQKGERKAIRIIDAQAAALARAAELEAECGALEHKLKAELESDWKGKALTERLEKTAALARASVLERVAADRAEQDAGLRDIWRAEIAAANARADANHEALRQTDVALAAANARADLAVRHVRYQQDEIRICLDDRNEASRRMNEANARAEAAEQWRDKFQDARDVERSRAERAESEVAALRAEVERLQTERDCAAQQVEFLCGDVRRLRAGYEAERGNAVSIASDLAAANAQLAEARALLQLVKFACPEANLGGEVLADIAAFLAANPVSPRAEEKS